MITQRVIITLVFFILCMSYVYPSSVIQSDNKIIVNVKTRPHADNSEKSIFINGFKEIISGHQISYHSSHPEAETALISRARSDMQSISWKSDTLFTTNKDTIFRLLWLAGIEKEGLELNGQPRNFNLYINGDHWFSFKNLKDSSAKKWTVRGRNNSTLAFEADMVDRHGDLFGRMIMCLPESDFRRGEPITIKVSAENAGSDVWYMTFTYYFNFIPAFSVEPAIMRYESEQSQILRISLDNLCSDCSVLIKNSRGKSINADLKVGANIFNLPIDMVKEDTRYNILFQRDGQTVFNEILNIQPAIKRDIYIIPYSHNDIGYTDIQENVERKQWQNLERALSLINKTKSYPDGSKFKWNIEVAWSLQSYFEKLSITQQKLILDEIRNGNICVNALYANFLTGLMSNLEMLHATDFARKFSKQYSVPVTTAVVSDIPGFTWGIVTALAISGVKYFSIAPNAGDRVGNVYENLGDKPFYWISQSGEEKVLTWLAAASYSTFHEGELSRLGEEKIMKIVRKLNAQKYPYRIVKLPYTIGGDNGPPDSTLSDFVKKWNEKYSAPTLRIATHAELFEDFEREYGKSLPTLRGDFTPYWEDGAASSAFETALNRSAAHRLAQGEILWSILSPDKFPFDEYSLAWKNVLLYDEHTWGAHNSVSSPDSPFVIQQWNVKRNFAIKADTLSNLLLKKAVDIAKDTKDLYEFEIYNTNSWTCTDVVILSEEISREGDIIIDSEGMEVPAQRLTTGELAILVKDIFPFSSRKYKIVKEKKTTGKVKESGNIIENNLIRVEVNRTTGALESIIWKERELVDKGKNLGINRYLYVPGKDPSFAQSLGNVKVSVKEEGEILTSLFVEADAPGCSRYTSEIRLYRDIERIDIINTIVKNAVREKEGVHFAFPFNVPQGDIHYDVAYGIVRPEKDQLPGSCKNFVSVQSFVDISNNEYGVTWVTPDAPLVEIGDINAEKPWMKSIQPSECIYSYVMNNYWHTNYKADQEGKVIFRYSIYPHDSFGLEKSVRFANERLQPLICLAGSVTISNNPFLNFKFNQNIIIHIKPLKNEEAWLFQLYNPSLNNQNFDLSIDKSPNLIMRLSNAFEEKLEIIKTSIDLPSFSTRFVRIDWK